MAGGGIPGPTLLVQVVPVSVAVATWPAATAAVKVDPPMAIAYVPGKRSTKPNQPLPSVAVVRTIFPVVSRSWTLACAAPASVPRICPRVGCARHGIAGTLAGDAKTGGVI